MAKRLLCVTVGGGSLALPDLPFTVTHASSVETFKACLAKETFDMVVIDAKKQTPEILCQLAHQAHQMNQQSFICVFGEEASVTPQTRIAVADNGAAMTSSSEVALRKAADIVFAEGSNQKDGYACPFCGKGHLSEDELWKHCPMYHLNEKNKRSICPICKKTPKDWIQVRQLIPASQVWSQLFA